jgi:hypothetical protein
MDVTSLCAVLLALHVLKYIKLLLESQYPVAMILDWLKKCLTPSVWKGKVIHLSCLSSPPVEKLTEYYLYAILHSQKEVDIFN